MPALPPHIAAALARQAIKPPEQGTFITHPGDGSLAPRVTAGRALKAGDAFLFQPATPPASRAALLAALAPPGPARDAVAAIAVPVPGDDSHAALLDGGDPLLARLWAWLRPSAAWAGSAARPAPAWFLEPPALAWARHAESPTLAVAEVEGGGGRSVAWLLADLSPGGEVSRDHALRPAGPPGAPTRHSLSSAAELLARLPPARWVHRAERDGLAAGVRAGLAASPPPGAGPAPPPPRTGGDPRPPPPPLDFASGPVPVWTDYPIFTAWLDGQQQKEEASMFVRTADRARAAIILTPSPVRDFLAQGSTTPPAARLNQFPFEAALVRKDLLPQTLRAHWARARPASNTALHPPWFPPAYDLATEAAWCLAGHAAAGGTPTPAPPACWALKPATASRSVGVGGTASAATVASFRAAGGVDAPSDFVAQAVVTDPWTTPAGRRKADLRLLVAVRAFGPAPSASLYLGYHARLAAEALPPSLGDALVSPSFSTVSCYDDEEAAGGAGAGGRAGHRHGKDFLSRGGVDAALAASGSDPAAVEGALADLAREVVLAGAAAIGGPWPACGAVYGLDVMLARGGPGSTPGAPASLTPQLLEVNFCPDLATAASFRPSLPGDLLAELYGPARGGEEGVFLPLFP